MAETATVTVDINGAPTLVYSRTLADLIVELGYADAKVATALNGDFIATAARASTPLHASDRVEILAPRQGG